LNTALAAMFRGDRAGPNASLSSRLASQRQSLTGDARFLTLDEGWLALPCAPAC